jgi:hypothetical protein
MQITQSSIDTQKGPADWFTGDVYIDAVAAPAGSSTFAAANVHFTPGAHRLAHPPPRPDDLLHRGRRPLPARRPPRRGHPSRRPRLLRARREPLARGRPKPLHGPPRHAAKRRVRQPCHLGAPRQRRRVRRGARQRQLTLQRDCRFHATGRRRVRVAQPPPGYSFRLNGAVSTNWTPSSRGVGAGRPSDFRTRSGAFGRPQARSGRARPWREMSMSKKSMRRLSEDERAERHRADRERLKRAAEELLTSEGWRRWVRVRATFHAYCLLISRTGVIDGV